VILKVVGLDFLLENRMVTRRDHLLDLDLVIGLASLKVQVKKYR
jgi:hypothetical protein